LKTYTHKAVDEIKIITKKAGKGKNKKNKTKKNKLSLYK
jgi:hypothetical protein